MVVWTGAREPSPLLVQLCKEPSSGQRKRRQKPAISTQSSGQRKRRRKPATSTQSSGQRERRQKPATSTGSALQVDMQNVRSNGSIQHQRTAARVKCSTRPLPPPPPPNPVHPNRQPHPRLLSSVAGGNEEEMDKLQLERTQPCHDKRRLS